MLDVKLRSDMKSCCTSVYTCIYVYLSFYPVSVVDFSQQNKPKLWTHFNGIRIKRSSDVIVDLSLQTLVLYLMDCVHGPSSLCACVCVHYKSLVLLYFGSQHWWAVAAGSQTSPGMAGGWWSVCSGWRGASWAAEASAEHLLVTARTPTYQPCHDIYMIISVLLCLKFSSPLVCFLAQKVCSVEITVEEKTENHLLAQKMCETSCLNIFHHIPIFVTHLQSSLTFHIILRKFILASHKF